MGALAVALATLAAATYVARPGGATTAVRGAANPTTQPLNGSTMGYLSNGDATVGWNGAQADNVSHQRGTSARGGYDVVILSMRVTVPPDANCLTFGASLFSEDFGNAVTDDPRYFDTFLAELDPPGPWSAGAGDPTTLDAPANFAKIRMPDGPTPVSALTHSLSFSTQQAYGTSYDGTTQWHTFKVPVTAGEHTVDLSLFDRADMEYDSTVVLDDLRLIRRRVDACTFPGRDQFSTGEDLEAPAVTIGSARGRLSGTASTGPDDESTVSVTAGGRTAHAVVEEDGSWSMPAGALPPGTHRVRASQFDGAGNEGLSAPVTITGDPPPPEEPEPEPTVMSTATPTSPPSTPPPPVAPPASPGTPPPPASPPSGPGGGPPSAPAPKRVAAAARCKVPKLRGKTVVAAGRALRRARCRVGKLTRKRARAGKRRRVIAQSPRAGLRRPAGTRVKLTVRR